jgi:hypothetical protein
MTNRILASVRQNIVAWLALFVALGGTSMAARHYIITSTKQIKPSVLKKLHGAVGKTGAKGAAGAPGASGGPGTQGKEGPAGPSALSTLPSGQSESGEYGASEATKSDAMFEAVTLPIPLAAGIPQERTEWTSSGSASHCSGPGHASPGYLCLYSAQHEEIELPVGVESYEGTKPAQGTGRIGFELEWETSGTSEAADYGTYTVTAP